MGIPVLVLGESGTGKSASLRNFNKDSVLVINVADKPLPFKNKLESVSPSYEGTYRDIMKSIKDTKKKVIVIDDAQYIMSFQYMRRIKENGWDKWNDIQGEFFNIINEVKKLPSDVIVYFLSHLQRNEEGYEKIKTMGKMLDEKITIEGLFSIVLKTNVSDGTYSFVTQNSGRDTVKSPIGMFPSYAIDNDLKYVDDKIRNYYEIGEFLSDKDIAEIDKEAEKVDVIKPSSDGKKRRSGRAKKEEVPAKEETSSHDVMLGEEPKTVRTRKVRGEKNEASLDIAEGANDEPKIYEDEASKPLPKKAAEEPVRTRRQCKQATSDTKEVEDVQTSSQEESAPRQRKRRARA